MMWINEPIANTGYNEQMFALSKEELKILKPVFERCYNEYKKKLDKLEDIRQSGEMTERQAVRWCDNGEIVATLECIIDSIMES